MNLKEGALSKTETAAGPETTALATQFPTTFGKSELYDAELVAKIIQRVALGETLTAICKEPGMPSRGTFLGWSVAFPAIRSAFDTARRYKASVLFEEALELAREVRDKAKACTAPEVNAYRLAVETLKWTASKLNPQEYGDKQPSNPTIAIQINTGLDLAATAVERDGDDAIFSFTAVRPLPAEPVTDVEFSTPAAVKRKKSRPARWKEPIDVAIGSAV